MVSNAKTYPPQTILDENGQPSGVILSLGDYRSYLKLLSEHTDWETLPAYLQDAIDNMLADEAEQEDGEMISLESLLTEE